MTETVTTIIERADGKIISHTGRNGITLTGVGTDENFDVLIEVGCDIKQRELSTIVGELLVFLEENFSERFVAECLGHYAKSTHKQFMEAGDHKLVMIRGGNRGKPKKGESK